MDPLELKQILKALRKGSSLEYKEAEMIRQAYSYARTSYRRVEQGEKYRHHTIRLAQRLLTEQKLSSPDLLCGVLLHHLDAPSLINSLSKHFSPGIVEAARLLSPSHADNFPNEEAYWTALRNASLPIRIAKILDQIDHLEHIDGVEERNRLLRETVKWVQPLADIINPEIASLLRESANRITLHIYHRIDPPSLWARLSNFLIEHLEWIRAFVLAMKISIPLFVFVYMFFGLRYMWYVLIGLFIIVNAVITFAFYIVDRLIDFFEGRTRGQIDKETKTQWMLDEAKGYENKSQWQEAIHVYQALLKKDAGHWEARIRLAELYERHLKELPKAQEEYRRIMNSAPPESVWHRRAREVLRAMQQDSE